MSENKELKEAFKLTCHDVGVDCDVEFIGKDFEEIMKKHAKATVVVDLTDVESVDAEAIGILVEEEHRLEKRGASLKIIGANSAVQHAFHRLGISHLLTE